MKSSRAMIEHEVPPRKSARERWAEIHRRGPWSYIIWRGILVAGLLFACLMLCDDYFAVFPGSHWRGLRSEILSFIFRALFFGVAMGWWSWRSRRRQFTKSA